MKQKFSRDTIEHARDLHESADAIAARIVPGLDEAEVVRIFEALIIDTNNTNVGASMMATAMVIASMASQSPDPDMLLAVMLNMIFRAMEARPGAPGGVTLQ